MSITSASLLVLFVIFIDSPRIDRLPRGVSAVNQGVQNLAETVRHLADGTLEVVHVWCSRDFKIPWSCEHGVDLW